VSKLALASVDAEPVAALGEDEVAEGREESLYRRLRRLALDVHDGPMQSLAGVGYALHQLRRRLDGADAGLADQCDTMLTELAGAERALRQLISTLEQSGTEELEQLSDIASLEIARFNRRCDAEVRLHAPSGEWPDSHSQEIAIRSVIRESLNNVAKHARASRVDVSLDVDDSGISLRVEDDGVGFDPTQIDRDRLGLGSMHERIQFLGGSIAVESRPGGPTVVTASVPRWRPERRR
jgi:signal transduction histidine kinase